MMLLRSLRIGICFIAVVILVGENSGESFSRNIIYENVAAREDEEDLPIKNDIVSYASSLKKILKFALRNKNEIDLNFAFGLSVMYDNLKHVQITKQHRLSKGLKQFLKDFLKKNRDLITYFKSMVKRDKNEKNEQDRLSKTLGVRGISDFVDEKISVFLYTKSVYPEWENYASKVKEFYKWKPNPMEADKCLSSLARSNWNTPRCNFKYSCYIMLVNGDNFGYALTHRLLWLLQAKRGRGCNIYRSYEDRDLMHTFCIRMVREANYIAANGFKFLDLMLEQMTLCPLAGYAHTLRRSWLAEVLEHQMRFGCFSPKSFVSSTNAKNDGHPWSISLNNSSMLGGACDRHLTAVAAGALSAAFRYIAETQF
ncbi:unnamed protein product [Parnassius apollo]|uniref:(apollo) hypothetical protein n=1 Tax=Parnassius apollo TaxID=110799 RepID=A0A8S3XYY2_PARAO|nr:unnamed protein product [Parnassius apollo]